MFSFFKFIASLLDISLGLLLSILCDCFGTLSVAKGSFSLFSKLVKLKKWVLVLEKIEDGLVWRNTQEGYVSAVTK